MSLFLCFVRAPFKLALLNWMPLDKYWIKKKKDISSDLLVLGPGCYVIGAHDGLKEPVPIIHLSSYFVSDPWVALATGFYLYHIFHWTSNISFNIKTKDLMMLTRSGERQSVSVWWLTKALSRDWSNPLYMSIANVPVKCARCQNCIQFI